MAKIAVITSEDGAKLLDDSLILFHSTYTFLLRARSSFYCTICDFDNHAAFNLPQKQFGIKSSTCQEIAENTIEYSFFMNTKLGPYLHDLTYVLSSFSTEGVEKPAQVKNFRKIKKVVNACA